MKKQRPVFRLTADLYNKPHLISVQSFSAIQAYLETRNLGMMNAMEPMDDDMDTPAQAGTVGIINIHGSLTNKPIQSMCGATGTSYAGLLDQMSMLIEAGCKTVVFDISSGGGEAFNCFQTANAMRAMADAKDVYLISYVQDCAASAAYALCVCADEVVAHPQGSVGSIGVLVTLVNNSKALAQAGITRTFVTAGANKTPIDAGGDFKEEFLADLQAQVDDLYGQFCEHVSSYTGLSIEDIKGTEASVYRAPVALEMGLINSIMTNEEFAQYLQTK